MRNFAPPVCSGRASGEPPCSAGNRDSGVKSGSRLFRRLFLGHVNSNKVVTKIQADLQDFYFLRCPASAAFFFPEGQKSPGIGIPGLRLSKKSRDFFDSLQECRYFRAAQRRKSPRSALRKPCGARRCGAFDSMRGGRLPPRTPPPQFRRVLLNRGFSTR